MLLEIRLIVKIWFILINGKVIITHCTALFTPEQELTSPTCSTDLTCWNIEMNVVHEHDVIVKCLVECTSIKFCGSVFVVVHMNVFAIGVNPSPLNNQNPGSCFQNA